MVADSELPQHEAPRPSIEPRATLGMPAPERKPLGLRIAAWSAGVLLLGVLASWTNHAIDSSLRELRAGSLTAVLDAEAQALDVWISEKELAARRLARDARLRAFVASLARTPAGCGADPPGLREPL